MILLFDISSYLINIVVITTLTFDRKESFCYEKGDICQGTVEYVDFP